MKLLNFSDLKGEFLRTLKTFPLSIFCGVAAALLMIYQNHLDFLAQQVGIYSTHNDVVPVVFSCIFAYLLFLAVDLFVLTRKSAWYKNIGRILAAGAVVAVYFTLLKDFKFWAQNDFMEFFILNLSGVLLVLVAPFLRSKVKMEDFWNYLVHTLFSFLFAFVLFGILFGGIALLFTSIDYLFHTNIDGVYYGDVFFVITGFLASSFFLGNFPKDFKKLKAEGNFFRILSEYFLVPLVIVYFVMLYVYTGKMVATWQWPAGGVAGWIIGFSMVGIFAYVFSYAIKEKSLGYVEAFKRWFFVALIPLTFVLFTALWFRVNAYGITVWRYLGFAFGLWLLMNALYFAISRAKDLRAFLVTLVAILMVAVYGGPISAFSITKEAQIQRLVSHLAIEGMIQSDNLNLRKVDEFNYKSENAAEVYKISQYLIDYYGMEVLKERFDGEVDKITVDNYVALNEFVKTLGFPADYYPSYPSGYVGGEQEVYLTFNSDMGCAELKSKSPEVWPACGQNVKGFDYLYDVNTGGYSEVNIEGAKYTSHIQGNYFIVDEVLGSGSTPRVLVNLNLETLAKSLRNEFGDVAQNMRVPQAKLNIEFVGTKFRGEFRISNLSAIFKSDKFERSDYINGYLLLKKM